MLCVAWMDLPTHLTDLFTVLEPQNPPNDTFYVVRTRRSTGFEALKPRKGRSGSYIHWCMCIHRHRRSIHSLHGSEKGSLLSLLVHNTLALDSSSLHRDKVLEGEGGEREKRGELFTWSDGHAKKRGNKLKVLYWDEKGYYWSR